MSELQVIHRIFFGFNGDDSAYLPYIKTWEEQLPHFSIKLWNATNLPLDICPYTRALSELQDGVFLGDYYRWWILYHYGGVYLDCDIEVVNGAKFSALLKELEESEYEAIIGIESAQGGYTSHSMAAKKHSRLAKFMCELYEHLGKLYLARKSMLISPQLVGLYFMDNGEFMQSGGFIGDIQAPIIVQGVKIYPKDYFSPLSIGVPPRLEHLSANTALAHHCAASWCEQDTRFFVNKLAFEKRVKLLKDYEAQAKSLRFRLKSLPKKFFINVCFPHNSRRRMWAKSLVQRLINFGLY
ncbi:hypothetical protein LS71_004215 [Helicobacter jaachi]|uniref:Glycosyl transferase n=1 Tax=Helicobacter jaachi TaxID=1677920 RepID=A0A4U8TAW0_9HELI|nr:glycosyltransferase [Helicobacter jaachi]TLD96814.1 hypothetical protein LS71_004215 [Helicobacter jaachi]